MGCATGLIKAIMFTFNFLFVVAGLALIAIGALFYLNLETYKEAIEPHFQIAPTLVLIVGIIVFVIAFFGCCGVCRESYCMLVTYAVLLLTLFALQLGIGIYAFMQVNETHDVEGFIEKSLQKTFKEYSTSQESREFFDVIQKELGCCGVTGPLNYASLIMPASCCNNDGHKCSILSSWQTGCANKLTNFLMSTTQTVSYVVGGIAAIEIVGAIFAICLASTLKNESRRRYP